MMSLINLMKVIKLISLACIGITLLSGCASLNSDFECPLQSGIKCKSVDEVNSLIDQGQFVSHPLENKCHSVTTNLSCASLFNKQKFALRG